MREEALWLAGILSGTIALLAGAADTRDDDWWLRVVVITALSVVSAFLPVGVTRSVVKGCAVGLAVETMQRVVHERRALQIDATFAPTHASFSPTTAPTPAPTLVPTHVPTRMPTVTPTRVPTMAPSSAPTRARTNSTQ